MTRRDASTPTPVGALLTAALPPLADKLLAAAVRREWSRAVGPEIARRAAPGDLRAGTLTVVVDNSPWLQELTLREGELLSRLQARFGADSIAALQLTLGAVSHPSEVTTQKTRRAEESLTPEEEAWVAGTTSSIGDPALAETVRRLLVKDALRRRPGART